MPPVSLRIVTGAVEAEFPVMDCLQHRTNRLYPLKMLRHRAENDGILGLLQQS